MVAVVSLLLILCLFLTLMAPSISNIYILRLENKKREKDISKNEQ